MSDLTITPKDTEVVETKEPISETQPFVPDAKGPTPSEMIEAGSPPYIVDILKGHPAYNTFDIKELSSEVDSYIVSEIKRLKLDDSRASYEKIYKEIDKNIKDTDDIYSQLGQLAEWVRLQNKIKSIIKEKEEFEMKDPLEMTSKQLLRYFNGK